MQDRHEYLMLRYLSGNLSPEEDRELRSWLEESPGNSRELEEYQKVWQQSFSPKAVQDFQSAEEWEKLKAAIDRENAASVKGRSISLKRPGWLSIAASIGVLMVSVVGIYLLLFSGKEELILKESGSQEMSFLLPDGSEVWLNKHSTLSYHKSFAQERMVSLSGEAFFEIEKDPEKPFVIYADKAAIRVLGTSFNVKAFEHSPLTEVYVLTGKVSLSSVEQGEGVMLHPGEMGLLHTKEGGVSVAREANPNALAWKEKRLTFKKAPLKEVIKTLEDYFSVNISVANPELLKCRFSSSFANPELEEVLQVLRHALQLTIKRSGDPLLIDGKGC